MPLAPSWQDAPAGSVASGYVGLGVAGVLDPRRFTKRAPDGSTYKLAPVPASVLAAADAERMERQARLNARREGPAAATAARAPAAAAVLASSAARQVQERRQRG